MDTLLNRQYDVAVANQPFLLEETRACARALLDSNWDAVAESVKEDNLLGSRSKSTATSYFRAIRNRLDKVPPDLLRLIANHDEETARFTLFYVLLNKNRLLRECMEEIVRDHMLDRRDELKREDMEAFFAHKRKVYTALTDWSDTTWRKFWQNTLKSIQETGLLQGQDPILLTPLPIPELLEDWLILKQEESFLHLMLVEDFLVD